MAGRVKVHEDATPSAALIAAAAAEVTAEDGGHTFTLQKPGILAQVNLIKVLGPEFSQNQALRDIYSPLLYLKTIDGEPVHQPQSMLQLDALLARVEESGIVAIMLAIAANYGQSDAKAHQDAVKN